MNNEDKECCNCYYFFDSEVGIENGGECTLHKRLTKKESSCPEYLYVYDDCCINCEMFSPYIIGYNEGNFEIFDDEFGTCRHDDKKYGFVPKVLRHNSFSCDKFKRKTI